MMKRLELLWVVIRHPMLVEPAIVIQTAIMNGSTQAESTIIYNDGTKKTIKYTVTSTEVKQEKCALTAP